MRRRRKFFFTTIPLPARVGNRANKKGSAVASLGDEAVWCGPGMGANPFRRHRLAAVPPDYLSEMAVQAALSPQSSK